MIQFPNKNMSVVENQIVERLVSDILAAGLTVSVWNGGDEPELADCTDLETIMAALAASDQDELTLDRVEGGYGGWVRLVYGNDCSVISDYTTRLEAILAPAEKLADELEAGEVIGLMNIEASLPNLISIEALAEAMRSRGWRVQGSSRYAECFAPDHQGPGSVWHHGSQYSTCTTSLYDKPGTGYGYNEWFYGPWHFGMIQRDSFAVRKILAHPSMAGIVI